MYVVVVENRTASTYLESVSWSYHIANSMLSPGCDCWEPTRLVLPLVTAGGNKW